MEEELIQEYQGKALQPTLDEVMQRLDLRNSSYPNLRAYLVKHGVCSIRDFNRARRAAFVKSALGRVPETAAELVDIVVDINAVSSASGSSELHWTCPKLGTRQPCDQIELEQEAQRINDNILENKFRESNISRAVAYWIDSFYAHERQICIRSLCLSSATFDWAEFAARALEDERVACDIQVAVMQKFIWQVKRRMSGLPVFDHIMPVLFGIQGTGKSEFVKALTALLGRLTTYGDFQRLSDNREVALFEAYIVVLDEMQKANRADIERVKNAITRDTFAFRPMHTNGDVQRRQNATFIGTSNRSLDQMIHDPTGNRRFFQIDWSKKGGPELWDYLNSISIEDMWRSVDHNAADPCAPFKQEIAEIQKQSVNRSTVGQFFDALVEGGGTCTVREFQYVVARTLTGTHRKEELFQAYRDFCDHMRIKSPLEAQSFYAEVRRMADQEADCPFRARKTKSFNGWEYVGPTMTSHAASAPSLIPLERRAA